jgi:hypothetical protein
MSYAWSLRVLTLLQFYAAWQRPAPQSLKQQLHMLHNTHLSDCTLGCAIALGWKGSLHVRHGLLRVHVQCQTAAKVIHDRLTAYDCRCALKSAVICALIRCTV